MADTNTTETKPAPSPEPAPVPKPVVTRHSMTIGGKILKYKATAGYMKMTSVDGKHLANIFYVAYTLEGARHASRPLTFAFNGGPGASSVWLHMGALGPQLILMDDEGGQLPPPYKYVTNEHTWLQFTDLVFIDPVGTGYSQPAKDEKPEQFLGVTEDLQSVGDFIRRYTTENRRWLSPKYLAGESYGTTRAAGLADQLHTAGFVLNGILLISSILQFQTVSSAPGNDLPAMMYLPTYTATAWYHKRLAAKYQGSLEKTLDEVRKWIAEDYVLALMKGDALSEPEKQRIAKRLADYTGLNPEYIRRTNLRIDIMRFCKELLRPLRKTVGRLDSRFTGHDFDAAGETFDYDPSYDVVIYGPFTAAVCDYLHGELGFHTELPYEVLSMKTHVAWNWGKANRGYPNLSDQLRSAMTRNPALRVFVANGYYDLATPFFATEYTMNHLGLEDQYRGNIFMEYYHAGHMMYIQKKSLVKLAQDVNKFFTGSGKNSGRKKTRPVKHIPIKRTSK